MSWSAQQSSDVVVTGASDGEAPHGAESVNEGGDEDEHEPEPNEQVDFFVEHVDHEHALDGVAMNVGEFTDREVTEGDTWKHSRILPFAAGVQVGKSLQKIVWDWTQSAVQLTWNPQRKVSLPRNLLRITNWMRTLARYISLMQM